MRRPSLIALAVTAALAVSAAAPVAAFAADDPSQPPDLPPAPAGFADSINGLYSTLYQTSQTLDGKTGQASAQQLTPPSDFQQSVSSLDPDQLAELYNATQQTSDWDQVAGDAQELLKDAQGQAQVRSAGSASSTRALRTRTRSARTTTRALASASSFPPDEPAGAFPPPPASFTPSQQVAAFLPFDCGFTDTYQYFVSADSASEAAITVAYIAAGITAGIPDEEIEEAAGEGTAEPDPAKFVASAISSAAFIAAYGFFYTEALADTCDSVNTGGDIANLDNTTVNSYALEKQNEQTLANTQSSVNTIHDQVHVLHESLTEQLTVEIQQALAQPASAPTDVYYELPASAGGNLDSTPVGVKAVVTDAYNAARQAGLAISPTVTRSLAQANQASRGATTDRPGRTSRSPTRPWGREMNGRVTRLLPIALALAALGVAAPAAGAASAPPGFAASLKRIYTHLYEAAHTLDAKTGRPSQQTAITPEQFAQRVDKLDPSELGSAYAATRKSANWDQVEPASKSLLDDAQRYDAPDPTAATPAQAHAARRVRRVHRVRRTRPRARARARTQMRTRMRTRTLTATAAQAGSSAFPPAEPAGSFPAPVAPFQPSMPVAPFEPVDCGFTDTPQYFQAAESAKYAASIVAFVAQASWADTPEHIVVFVAGEGASFPNPAKVTLGVVAQEAWIVYYGFAYTEELANDCDGVNAGNQAANIDNTTLNLYELEKQNEQTLATTESSINTIHEQIHVVQQSVNDQLRLDIRRALVQPTSAPRNVAYELPASAGGNLDSTPIGVKAIVTDAYNAAKQAGLAINPTATRSLAMANQALAAGQYKTAWQQFQVAFQTLG